MAAPRPPKILVIDDDLSTQGILRQILKKEGFEVISAVDAMQGPMQARKAEPDLIVLDLMMPAGGGASVLNRLRHMEQFVTTPVVIYSVKPREEILSEVSEDEFTRVLTKPAPAPEILAAVKSLLKKA